MLLRGVKFPPPALDKAEIEVVRSKAASSGRGYGGAPLRNGNGGGRGGRINYASERPNPFAAHINPNFVPPPGWVPPAPGTMGYSQGPPPPPRGGFNDSYRPSYPGGPQQSGNQHGGYYSQESYYNQSSYSSQGYNNQSYHSQSRGGSYQSQHYGSGRNDRNDRRDGGYSGGYRDQGRQGRDNYPPRRNDGYGRY